MVVSGMDGGEMGDGKARREVKKTFQRGRLMDNLLPRARLGGDQISPLIQ